ncbi:MAG: hypothetical protein AAFN92_04705 [Bacteroidota bacterium]
MTNDKLLQQLAPLRQAPPSVPLSTVTNWITHGRPHPRFHALAWLSRVGWRLPN